MKEKKFIRLLVLSVSLLLLVLAFIFNGTGDSGDSIGHFLYAKYAYIHTANFFNSWAKPLYVLLGAPFSQLGFIGIKFFNISNTIVSVIAAYFVAKRLNMANIWIVPVLLMLAPLNFGLALTGLTEPLFAAMLICGVCLLFYDKVLLGLIVISFLPFVRSEGMFVLILVGIYLLYQRRFFEIIYLAIGQSIYAVVGYLHYKNFLWFFKSNPYSFISQYGHGGWLDYFRNLPIVIGPASCLLLAIGYIILPYSLINKVTGDKENRQTYARMLLIWCLFSCYFFFHVIAWKFGLFGSFGMTRIIVGVAPLMAILCLQGFNYILTFLSRFRFLTIQKKFRYSITLVLLINATYMVVNFVRHSGTEGMYLTLRADQVLENKIADYIKQKYPDYHNRTILYGAPYISIALNIDPFDTIKHFIVYPKSGILPANSLCLWDDWFSVIECGLPLDFLKSRSQLVIDTNLSMYDPVAEHDRQIVLFKAKQ
jgi:hypothetical protein